MNCESPIVNGEVPPLPLSPSPCLLVSDAGVGGDKNDLYVCAPASLGQDTACTLGFFWDAAAHGLEGGNVRGFALILAEVVVGSQAVEPAAGQALHLPLVARP